MATQNRIPTPLFAAAALVLGLGLSAPHAQAGDKLNGDEILRLVNGRVGNWTTGDGQHSGTTLHHAGGTLSSKVKIFGSMKDVPGTWEVKGDRFCRTVALDVVKTRCQTVVKVSGGTYHFVNADGSIGTVASFR